MHNLHRPLGLIRYASETPSSGITTKKYRPRVVIYAVLWTAAVTVGIVEFVKRNSFHAQIVPVASNAYFMSDTRIKNLFSVRLFNQSDKPQTFHLSIDSDSIAEQSIILETPSQTSQVEPGDSLLHPVMVSVSQNTLNLMENTNPSLKKFDYNLIITDQNGQILKLNRKLLKP